MDVQRLFAVRGMYSHARLGLILGATGVYVVGAIAMHPIFGDAVLIGVSAPALLTAWSFGARAGLFGSLIGVVLNMLLVTAAMDVGLVSWLYRGGALGGVALAGAALMVGHLRDYSRRLDREEVLRESESRYRALFESAPVGIAISEASGVIVHTNPAFQKMLGRAEEELRGTTLRDLRPPGTPNREGDTFRRLSSGGARTVRHARQLMHSNGDVRWLQVTGSAVPSETAQVEQIYRMFEDVTDRKRAEEGLQESESRYRTLLESAPVGIAIVDVGGGMVHVNAALERILGRSERELRGKSLRDYRVEDQRSSAGVRFSDLDLMSGDSGPLHLERQLRRSDGDPVWVL